MYAYCLNDPVNLYDPSGMAGKWVATSTNFTDVFSNDLTKWAFNYLFDSFINLGKGTVKFTSKGWAKDIVIPAYGYQVYENLPDWVDGNRLWIIGMAAPLFLNMAVIETPENVLDLAEYKSLVDQHYDVLKAIGPAFAFDIASIFFTALAPKKVAYTASEKALKKAATATGVIGTTGITGGVIALTVQAFILESQMVNVWNRIQSNSSFYVFVSFF